MKSHIIRTDKDKEIVIRIINELVINRPYVIDIKQYVKPRTNGQNSFLWVGMLADFSMQVFVDGKQFSVNTWHEYLKELHLPEQYEEGITLKNYKKWEEMPNGKLKMVGSTKKLTTKGFSEYMERCYNYGTYEHDIQFTAAPNQYNAEANPAE